jgi:DNA-binding PadR family transcriptional regulator
MSRKSPERDPRSYLPLTPRVFHVLLALSDGPRHGYALILDVRAHTEGLIELKTGTLYMLVQRLLNAGLIEESDNRPRPDEDDERRRYYRLTGIGRAVLQAESRRLQSVVSTVRRKRVLGTEKP